MLKQCYHADIVSYISSTNGDIHVKKQFENADDIKGYFKESNFLNRIVTLDKDNKKVVVDTHLIAELKDMGILEKDIPFFTAPNLPFYITGLVSKYRGLLDYCSKVTIREIKDHYKKFNNTKYQQFLQHLVYPIFGTVASITPDRFIIRTLLDEKISIKRKKGVDMSINDEICVLATLTKTGIFHYAFTVCNVTKRKTDFNNNPLYVFDNKFNRGIL